MKKFLPALRSFSVVGILIFILTAVNMYCMEEGITNGEIYQVIYDHTHDSVTALTPAQRILILEIHSSEHDITLNEEQTDAFESLPKFIKLILEHKIIQSISDIGELDLGDDE